MTALDAMAERVAEEVFRARLLDKGRERFVEVFDAMPPGPHRAKFLARDVSAARSVLEALSPEDAAELAVAKGGLEVYGYLWPNTSVVMAGPFSSDVGELMNALYRKAIEPIPERLHAQ